MPINESNSTNDLDHSRVEVNGLDGSGVNRAVQTKLRGDGLNALAVDIQLNDSNGSETPSCGVISKKHRVDWLDSDIVLNGSGGPYITLYTYSGSGKFFGGSFRYNTDKIVHRLLIDGEQIFDLDLKVIKDMTNASAPRLCSIGYNNGDGTIIFCPPCPIKYSSSIVFEAKGSDASGKKMKSYVVELSKET